MKRLSITQPDDWHLHLRDNAMLTDTVPATARHFARALIMPNLTPALTTTASLLAYRERIMTHIPEGSRFTPLMTLYLNDSVTPDELNLAQKHAFILGAKLYPKGATTNAEVGAADLTALYPLFDVMQQLDLVLQIHGESTTGDIFDRETTFLTESLSPILKQFPRLRIVLEHISTRAAVDFVTQGPETLAATITPHHLLYQRNHLLAGGIRPHYYCLPILKRESDQRALQEAATSRNPKFFAGTDSAPHSQSTKESSCGCAGIYSAPFAIPLYTQIFDSLDRLNRLNHFLGHFGAIFYGVPINTTQLVLEQNPQQVPEQMPFGHDIVIPMEAGRTLAWSVHEIQ